MINLDFKLLPWQQEIWKDPTRFKVIAAGRRTGKTRLAAYRLCVSALTYPDCAVVYMATTQGQARRLMWKLLHSILGQAIKSSNINNLEIFLINGSIIYLLGSDRPDTARGLSLRDAVLDEYADMKPEVWEEIIRPALSDFEAPAMFIGTPKGRNHFYELYKKAEYGLEDFKAYHLTTYDNPYIPKREIDTAKKTMSSFAFKQEYMASFEATGSNVFKEEWVQYGDEPKGGVFYIAADLAGFEAKAKNLDNSAIAVVKVHDGNWWVAEILVGRWGVEETASKLFNLVEKYSPVKFGIERGIAKQAVMPTLTNMMARRNKFFKVEELTHGNEKKSTRIIWALQGLFEHGRIKINKGPWNMQFLDELFQFPDPLTHDDMIDALSYINQLSKETYIDFEDETYEPLDMVAGY